MAVVVAVAVVAEQVRTAFAYIVVESPLEVVVDSYYLLPLNNPPIWVNDWDYINLL
ncbi:MAG: hypothetical protein JSV09_14455 [Thermoplasmata archaeon]|nr:MAG: hypothetical protein JSV09_14455 [Thermoplasmata archaeon]